MRSRHVCFIPKVVSDRLPIQLPCFVDEVYGLMRRCWCRVPVGRLRPEDMKTQLIKMRTSFVQSSEYPVQTIAPNLKKPEVGGKMNE